MVSGTEVFKIILHLFIRCSKYYRCRISYRHGLSSFLVSMHRMPFTIPAELSCALATLHSRQRLITSANFIPHYPLSYIPYFPYPICYHHNHKYLRPTPSKYTRKSKVYHPCTRPPSAAIATGSVNPLCLLAALSPQMHFRISLFPSTYLTYGLNPISPH